MRAVTYDAFGALPLLRELPDPVPTATGVVVRVEATGLCRSDVHAWLGHDDGVSLPHVPGHELVGYVEAVGPKVRHWGVGQRVTTPFVCACGACPECAAGQEQVCRHQTQPGFTHFGSFAELVAIHEADLNLVAVPDDLDAGAAALLGCRFATAYRGLADLARLAPGETVLVVGCGGVGLSAVAVAVALGGVVIGVDVDPAALDRATAAGAGAVVAAADASGALRPVGAVVDEVRRLRPDGVPISVDALGRAATLEVGLRCLAPRGRHVQIGLLPGDPVVPVGRIVAGELALLGSHGMAARDYPRLMTLVTSGRLRPQDLVTRWIGLDDVPGAMAAMAHDRAPGGVTMIRPG